MFSRLFAVQQQQNNDQDVIQEAIDALNQLTTNCQNSEGDKGVRIELKSPWTKTQLGSNTKGITGYLVFEGLSHSREHALHKTLFDLGFRVGSNSSSSTYFSGEFSLYDFGVIKRIPSKIQKILVDEKYLKEDKNENQEQLDKCTESKPQLWTWGQGIEPNQKLVDEYKMKKEKYDDYVAQYRSTHNGEAPPPPKLLAIPLMDLSESDEEEHTADVGSPPWWSLGGEPSAAMIDKLKNKEPLPKVQDGSLPPEIKVSSASIFTSDIKKSENNPLSSEDKSSQIKQSQPEGNRPFWMNGLFHFPIETFNDDEDDTSPKYGDHPKPGGQK